MSLTRNQLPSEQSNQPLDNTIEVVEECNQIWLTTVPSSNVDNNSKKEIIEEITQKEKDFIENVFKSETIQPLGKNNLPSTQNKETNLTIKTTPQLTYLFNISPLQPVSGYLERNATHLPEITNCNNEISPAMSPPSFTALDSNKTNTGDDKIADHQSDEHYEKKVRSILSALLEKYKESSPQNTTKQTNAQQTNKARGNPKRKTKNSNNTNTTVSTQIANFGLLSNSNNNNTQQNHDNQTRSRKKRI